MPSYPSVNFTAHMISIFGIVVDPAKVEIILLRKEFSVFHGGRHERLGRVERRRREEMRERHGRRGEEPRREEIDIAKFKIPQFLLVTLEFGKYALPWWTQMLDDIRRRVRDPYEDWVVLKWFIRGIFVPPYIRYLHNKLQGLYQGSWSEEEYHKKMEKGQKETTSTRTPVAPRTSNIKLFKFLGKEHIAFQCPNRRVMIVKDDGEIKSESSIGELSSSSNAEVMVLTMTETCFW
ncbi:hypothetical protein CR513_35832, partial [Mucuna pruriens]